MVPNYHTIVCGHGLEPRAPEVLAHAFGLARSRSAGVVVVHAIEPPSAQTRQMVEAIVPKERIDGLRGAARREAAAEIEEQVRELLQEQGISRLREVRVLEGRAVDSLLGVAREVDADVIVIGAHRHTALGELLLGSTAHRVAQRSPVPVLLVRLAE